MNCLAFLTNLFRKHQGKITYARNVRNNYLSCFEKFYMALSTLFLIFGFIMIATGTSFIVHDLWAHSKFGLGRVQALATMLIVVYCIMILVFGVISLAMAYYRDCHPGCMGLYGTLLFLIIACPLMGEGSAILEISHISNDEI